MPLLTTNNDAEIYYKDWGKGQAVVFSHGWPLSGDSWDAQMMFLAERGYRCIAHDRRGHGRSSQTWDGNDMDTYASDLAQLIEEVGVSEAVLVGFSAGGGEVARYVGTFGSGKVAKVVLVGAVTPLMVQTSENPEGVPSKAFDKMREDLFADRAQFYRDTSAKFFGSNRIINKASHGMRDQFCAQAMQGGLKNHYDSIKAFSETDFTADLLKFDFPTLIIHGDDDQLVPIGTSATMAAKLVRNSELKVYGHGPHGITDTHQTQLNTDLLQFLRA